MQIETFIAEQQAAVEDRERAAQLAYWNAGISGTNEDEKTAARLMADVKIRYADPERFARLKAQPPSSDPDLARQQTLLVNAFTSCQSPHDVIAEIAAREMEIETLFSTFRADLRGEAVTDNDLRTILQKSDDNALRQDAWEASKQIGAVAKDRVLDLVRLRNREAKRLGFPDYYIMQVRLQELDENVLFALLEDVSAKLTPHFIAYKETLDRDLARRFGVAANDLRPWHYGDPFFQDAPEAEGVSIDPYFDGKDLAQITETFFRAIGLETRAILERSDLYEKPNKMQHAYCIAVGRSADDVRVLCNCRSNAQWMGTMLHEFGHAVYDTLIDRDLPFFLRTVTHTMTTEAIAQIMGRHVDNGAWLRRYAGVPEEEGARVARAAAETNRAHLLVFTQWVQVMAHFERALYADPDQDLNALWWRMVEKYQRIRPVEGRDRPVEGRDRPVEGRDRPDWASKIHLATSPVYYHNYLMGEMTASQLLHVLKTRVVASEDELVSSPVVGAWLTENVFRPGARYSWNELLTRATGEPLNPAYFVDELAGIGDNSKTV